MAKQGCRKCGGFINVELLRSSCVNCGTADEWWSRDESERYVQGLIDRQLRCRSIESMEARPKPWGPALAHEKKLAEKKASVAQQARATAL